MTEPRTGYMAPEYERPVAGETAYEAGRRRHRNWLARAEWRRFMDARCQVCGQVRFHVSHEMDPVTSPEGPEYHADLEHHAFEETT